MTWRSCCYFSTWSKRLSLSVFFCSTVDQRFSSGGFASAGRSSFALPRPSPSLLRCFHLLPDCLYPGAEFHGGGCQHAQSRSNTSENSVRLWGQWFLFAPPGACSLSSCYSFHIQLLGHGSSSCYCHHLESDLLWLACSFTVNQKCLGTAVFLWLRLCLSTCVPQTPLRFGASPCQSAVDLSSYVSTQPDVTSHRTAACQASFLTQTVLSFPLCLFVPTGDLILQTYWWADRLLQNIDTVGLT